MEATSSITFEIPGEPVAQPRPVMLRTGRVYTPTKNGIDLYKRAVGLSAIAHAGRARWKASGDPHRVEFVCVFSRPACHLTTKGQPSSKFRRFPGKPDGDNLEKGIWDAITRSGAIWLDDSQVVSWSGEKRYAEPGEAARTIVRIVRISSS